MGPRGFTLVETAIVIAIAGILLALAVPAVEGYMERTRIAQAITDIADMSTTIKAQERIFGTLPGTLASVQTRQGVVDLSQKVDPWGRPYRYLVNPQANIGQARKDKSSVPINSDFDLYSIGKDGLTQLGVNKPESRDDVLRARDGNFIGLASDFDPT